MAHHRSTRHSGRQAVLHGAVDFGTTFTTFAYAFEDDTQVIKDIHVMSTFSVGPQDKRDEKGVPTILAYRRGQRDPVGWGWQALELYKRNYDDDDLILAERFKLFLSNAEHTEDIRRALREKLCIDGRQEVDLIVDFLTFLRQSIHKYLQAHEDNETLANCTYQWTFTVPADWSPSARRFMIQAANDTGFIGQVKLISEPEAAALCILERSSNRRLLSLEAAAVVGDLGGGTSDCATFVVTTLDPVSLKGIASVQGIVCGAEDLIDRFRQLLTEKLKVVAKEYLEEVRMQTLEQIVDDAVDHFRSTIKKFDGGNNDDDGELEWVKVLNLRKDTSRGFNYNGFRITRQELREQVFNPVVDQIIDLLDRQITDSIQSRSRSFNRSGTFNLKHLYLTGGLAGNDYVCQRINAAFDQKAFGNQRIQVKKALSPETAVVVGAVWRSLHPERVSTMVSETSYGFRQDENWTPDWSHGGPGRVRNPFTGEWEMKDRMKWVVKKNIKTKLYQSAPYHLQRFVPVGGSLKFCETMYYSDIESQDHVHFEQAHIHEFGQIDFNLEKWRSKFQVLRTPKGDPYMEVNYYLISSIGEDEWNCKIKVLIKERETDTQFKECDTEYTAGGCIAAGVELSKRNANA